MESCRDLLGKDWRFAHDDLNYARYLSAYVSEMSHLEEKHPEAFKYLKSGRFSVQIGIQAL